MTGPVAGGGAAGHFAFDPDELRSIIQEWMILVDSYRDDARRAEALTKVQGPGDEGASSSLAAAANRSGSELLKSLQKEREYCDSQIARFQHALNQYLGVDDANAQVIAHQLPDAGTGQRSGAL